jgi:hypothetical protein
VAKFNAEDLLIQRDTVSKSISTALRNRAAEFGIVLEDVVGTDG